MRSPTDRLLEALEAWQRERAAEQVARWRDDPAALDEARVAARHARLRGPRARELFEDAVERGLLEGDDRAAVARALREAQVAPARAEGTARVRAALDAPVPYDSDFHRGATLLARLAVHPDPRARRAMARALGATFEAVVAALEERRARVEEASEAAAWLPDEALDRAEVDPDAALAATDDAWREAIARVAHAARVGELEHFADLFFALRAPRWDDLVPRASRPRRLAGPVAELGLGDVLGRVRLEPARERLRAAVLVVAPSRDVRVSPGVELGLAAERDLAAALARAAAHLLAHPGLPALLRRPGPESVARTLGALHAHLFADPVFADRAYAGLSPRERRAARELALALELFELRTAAASCHARAHLGRRDFPDRARDALVRAWTADAPASLACALAGDDDAMLRLRAARLAPVVAVALRERHDEDFFRNPRTAEPLRHAAARGARLSAEAWAEELGASPAALGPRMTELLG